MTKFMKIVLTRFQKTTPMSILMDRITVQRVKFKIVIKKSCKVSVVSKFIHPISTIFSQTLCQITSSIDLTKFFFSSIPILNILIFV
jgi:hypothetical protein